MARLQRISLLILRINLAYYGLASIALLIAWELPWSISALVLQQQRALFVAMTTHGVAVALLMIGAWTTRRARTITPLVPRSLMACAIVCFVVSVDLLVAIAFPPWETKTARFRHHALRGWTNDPGGSTNMAGATVLMDELGLRIDENGSSSSRTDVPSLLVVGDSVALGWGLGYRDAFGVQAVEILKSRHSALRLQPRLGATAGYDTSQEANWLEEIGLGIKPSIVVVQLCLNDVFLSYNPNQIWSNRFSNDFIHPGPPLSWSGIGRAYYSVKNLALEGTGLFKDTPPAEWFGVSELLAPKEGPRVLAAWDRTMKAFDHIDTLCKSAKVPLVVIFFPLADQMSDPKTSRHGQVRVSEWATAHGAVFVDVLPEYIRRTSNGGEARRRFFLDLTHPSTEGHRVAAELLAAAIERMPVFQTLPGH